MVPKDPGCEGTAKRLWPITRGQNRTSPGAFSATARSCLFTTAEVPLGLWAWHGQVTEQNLPGSGADGGLQTGRREGPAFLCT